jgi:hypothetical protein
MISMASTKAAYYYRVYVSVSPVEPAIIFMRMFVEPVIEFLYSSRVLVSSYRISVQHV